MIKEDKNIDFYTSGRQPSEQDFVRVSEWINDDKRKNQLNNLQNERSLCATKS